MNLETKVIWTQVKNGLNFDLKNFRHQKIVGENFSSQKNLVSEKNQKKNILSPNSYR